MAWYFTIGETNSSIKYELYNNSAVLRTLCRAAEASEVLEFPGFWLLDLV